MSAGLFAVKTEKRKTGEGKPALVIVAPKKIFPKAVDRNMLKRRVRASFRELGYAKNLKNLKIRVTALPASKDATYKEIKLEFEQKIS